MTTITTGNHLVTLINVFTVRPEHQQRLVDLLVTATEQTIKHQTGYISANIHLTTVQKMCAHHAASLSRIILDQSTEKLPAGLELGMPVYFGPRVRIHGPQLRIDAKTGIWRCPDTKQNFSGIIEMSFGWTPYPGDYRSEAAIIAARRK